MTIVGKGEDMFFKDQKEQARYAIKTNAVDLFRTQGYGETSVEHITQSVGIAKGTFYNYFPSKRALLVEWAQDRFEELEIDINFSEKSILDNLSSFISLLLEKIETDRALFKQFLQEYFLDVQAVEFDRRFDMDSMLICLIQSSKDFNEVHSSQHKKLAQLLSGVLFWTMISNLKFGLAIEEIEDNLKSSMRLCLYGAFDKEE